MSRVVVARPVNGITLNDELEFLLDDSGKVRTFASEEDARTFLIAAGIDMDELRHMIIMAN